MPRVIHFEINATDAQRAVEFYTKVFGWTITKWEGPFDYWLISTGEDGDPGIDGAIMAGGGAPTVNTIDVPSVDEFIEKVKAAGGRLVSPKNAIPGVGYHAYCEDAEGIPFGMMEADPAAG